MCPVFRVQCKIGVFCVTRIGIKPMKRYNELQYCILLEQNCEVAKEVEIDGQLTILKEQER